MMPGHLANRSSFHVKLMALVVVLCGLALYAPGVYAQQPPQTGAEIRAEFDEAWGKEQCKAISRLLGGGIGRQRWKAVYRHVESLDPAKLDTAADWAFAGAVYAKYGSGRVRPSLALDAQVEAAQKARKYLRRLAKGSHGCADLPRTANVVHHHTADGFGAELLRAHIEVVEEAARSGASLPANIAELYENLAELELSEERPKAAEAAFEAGLRHTSGTDKIFYIYGAAVSMAQRGEFERTRAFAMQCLKLEGAEKPGIARYCFRVLGPSSTKLGHVEKLLDLTEQWVERMADDEMSRRTLIEEVLIALEDAGKASEHIDRTLALAELVQSGQFGAWQKAKWLHRAGRYDEAWKLISNASGGSGPPIDWKDVAIFFANALDVEHAKLAAKHIDTRHDRFVAKLLTQFRRLTGEDNSVAPPTPRSRTGTRPPFDIPRTLEQTDERLDPNLVYTFRRELIDRGLLDDAVERIDWGFTVMERAPHGSYPAATVEPRRDGRLLLHAGLLDEYDRFRKAVAKNHAVERRGLPVNDLLRTLIDPEASDETVVDTFFEQIPHARPHGPLSTMRLATLAWGRGNVVDALAEREDSQNYKRQKALTSLRAESLIQNDRLEQLRTELGDAAEALEKLDPNDYAYTKQVELIRRQLVIVATLTSPQRARKWLGELFADDAQMPATLADLELRLDILMGKLPEVEIDSLPRRARHWSEQFIVQFYCRWPWDASGTLRANFENTERRIDRDTPCPDIANSLPTDPLAETNWRLRSRYRALGVRMASVRRGNEHVHLVSMAMRAASVPLTERTVERAHQSGTYGDFRTPGWPSDAKEYRYPVNPQVVEAALSPRIEAYEGHRQARRAVWIAKLARAHEPQDARRQMLDDLTGVQWHPQFVEQTVELLARHRLWGEMARVVGPKLESKKLESQTPTTLELLVEANARLGFVDEAKRLAKAYEKAAEHTFDARLRVARIFERHGHVGQAKSWAESAAKARPNAPAPKALLARLGNSAEAVDTYHEPLAYVRAQLVAALRSEASKETVRARATKLLQANLDPGAVLEVFAQEGAYSAGVDFLDATLGTFVDTGMLDEAGGYTRRFVDFLTSAGEHERAEKLLRRHFTFRALTYGQLHSSEYQMLSHLFWARDEADQALRWAHVAVEERGTGLDHPGEFFALGRAQALAGCTTAAAQSFERALIAGVGSRQDRLDEILDFLRQHPTNVQLTERVKCEVSDAKMP